MMTAASANSKPPVAWILWLRIVVSVTLVAFLYYRVDWTPIGPLLRKIEWGYWAAALVVLLSAHSVSAVRWRGLAKPAGFDLPLKTFVKRHFEGMFFSLCLSSVSGDVYKAYRLGPNATSRLLAGCTLLADRVSSISALLIIGLTAIATRMFDLTLVQAVVVGAALVATALAAIRLAVDALRWLTRRGRGNRALRAMWSQLFAFQLQPELMTKAIGWSLLVQALNVIMVVLLGTSMDLDLSIEGYCIAVPAVAVIAMLPVAIAGVGIREIGMAWILTYYAVPQAEKFTLGLLWFLTSTTAGLIGGLVYLRGAREVAAPLKVNDLDRDAQLLHGMEANRAFALQSFRRARECHMSLSVVVPIYNELENVRRLYDALMPVLKAIGRPYEVLLVDDGSTDGSAVALDELASIDSNIKVVHFRRNFGQTAAMNAGIHMATGDVIVTLDADLQNDPTDIPMMLEKLSDGYDLVHGWRKNRQDTYINRKLPSKIANWVISRVTGFPVHDLGCTLKVMRREIAQELQLYGEMHRFIPILAHWRGAKCAEVVTKHHARQYGASKYGISRTVRVILDLITVKYMTQYLTSPMKLFGKIGLASGLVAMAAGLATVVMKINSGADMTGNPLLLLTVFAGFLSVQFFILGMLGELGVRTYYESQNKTYYAIRNTRNFDRATSGTLTIHRQAA